MSNNSNCSVLYVDHSGHPAPLSISYHATAARELSSSLPFIPSSTITEVDTAYCPQCLYYASYTSTTLSTSTSTSTSTSNKGNCPNPTCRRCPICISPLNVKVVTDDNDNNNENLGVYSCSYCRWDSRECQVQVQVQVPVKPQKNLDISSLEKSMAQDLADALQIKMDTLEMESSVQDAFQKLLSHWGKRAQEEDRRKRYQDGHGGLSSSSHQTTTTRKFNSREESKSWSVESLEESLPQKQLELKTEILANVWESQSQAAPPPSKSTTPQQNQNDKVKYQSSSSPTSNECIPQGIQHPGPISSPTQLVPLPMALKPKTSRRCRNEIQKGKPGILIKPKANPLEGDSSLRSGHGQWWKKDSSAIHMVPKVHICKVVHDFDENDNDNGRFALLLRVTNPTLTPVNLRFNLIASRQQQQQQQQQQQEQEQPPSSFLKNLLMDHIHKTYVDAILLPHATSPLSDSTINTNINTTTTTTTEMMTLEPVEDAFLELGKGRIQTPKEVDEWNGMQVLQSWKSDVNDNDKSQIQVKRVASDKDVAWIEFLVQDTNTNTTDRTTDQNQKKDTSTSTSTSKIMYRAAYMTMEVEVGNGSWESSLIKRNKHIPEEEMDLVPFQLVLVWKSR